MKYLFATFLVLSVFASPAVAERVRIPETSVSFEPPTGFTELSQAEIDVKFPSKKGPAFVIGNERRTTTVAYDVKPLALQEKDLQGTLDGFDEMLKRGIPGLVWKERKLLELDGQKWIYLEMTSTALDTDIYNILLMTPYSGKTLVFNFNSTKEDFPKLEAVLRASVASIRFRKL